MSLRINHNIASINGHRNMLRNDMAISKSLEKLSSGLKINRAADDAAGLIISEQMRAQIAGLNQAVDNTETAIAMVQTAEGALDEMNTLLNKARELAIHAANDGANDATQLAADQSELDNIVQSITRIANNTQFGTKKILDGTLDRTSLVTIDGGGTAAGNAARVETDVAVPTTGVRRLDAGVYEAFMTTAYNAGTAAQGEVEDGGFTGAALTGAVAAGSLTAATGLDAGDYQVALRSSTGNVFVQTFTATHTSANDNAALSGAIELNGTLTAAGSLVGGSSLADTDTHVTAEVTSLNNASLSIAGPGTLTANNFVSGTVLNDAADYTLAVTNGVDTYSVTFNAGVGDDVADLVSAFNTDGANVAAGVSITWTGAGAPAITFTGAGSEPGANGNGFYVTLSDTVSGNTATAAADPTTTGVTGAPKVYTVELVDSGNNVRGTYTENVAVGAGITLNQMLANFEAGALLSGDVTAIAGVSVDAAGVIDFDVTVDGGVNANGYRIRISDGTNAVLSAASAGSIADDTLGDLITDFDAGLTGASVDASVDLTLGAFDLDIGTGLAVNEASNGYSVRLTNLTSGAVVNSDATSGGTEGVETMAAGELRDNLGNVVATLTSNSADAVLANSDYGISINLVDAWAANVANEDTTTGVTFDFADDQDGAVFQIGANRDQTVSVAIRSAKATDLGKNTTNVTDANATLDSLRTGSYLTGGLAQEAISVIDKAIDDITNLRGDLGAVQSNSLESNLSSLRATLENTTAAESVIRDVDFAAESAIFTKNSILIQASTAMLAQANQLPQNVLQLLG